MRRFLWTDVFRNTAYYTSVLFPVHAFVTVVAVFIAGYLFDLLRVRFVEKPMMKWLEGSRLLAWLDQKMEGIW